MTPARALAALGALAGVVGLFLQFVLIYGNMGENGGSAAGVLWRFLGYFTILSNILITAILIRAARRPSESSERVATLEAVCATAILFVGAVYHLMLASRWDPQGWQLVADILLHTMTPIVFALFWLVRPHGFLKWRDAIVCALWPFTYAIYALARGAGDGWYAYYFLDPSQMTLVQLAASVGGLMAAFLIGALILVALDKALARRAAKA